MEQPFVKTESTPVNQLYAVCASGFHSACVRLALLFSEAQLVPAESQRGLGGTGTNCNARIRKHVEISNGDDGRLLLEQVGSGLRVSADESSFSHLANR